MKKLLLACLAGGLFSSAAIADEPVELLETVPSKNKDRRVVIEMIRVTSEKTVIESEASDAAVQSILDELEALEDDIAEEVVDDTDGS